MSHKDEAHGRNVRHEDWTDAQRLDVQTDSLYGERVTSPLALEIAADVLHAALDGSKPKWTANDIKLALGALAGIAGQQGVVSADSDFFGYGEDGFAATCQLDIWIYG